MQEEINTKNIIKSENKKAVDRNQAVRITLRLDRDNSTHLEILSILDESMEKLSSSSLASKMKTKITRASVAASIIGMFKPKGDNLKSMISDHLSDEDEVTLWLEGYNMEKSRKGEPCLNEMEFIRRAMPTLNQRDLNKLKEKALDSISNEQILPKPPIQ